MNVIMVIASRRIRWATHILCKWDISRVYKNFPVKPEDKKALGRFKRTMEFNIKVDIQGIACNRIL
jgi:hypothetical protein